MVPPPDDDDDDDEDEDEEEEEDEPSANGLASEDEAEEAGDDTIVKPQATDEDDDDDDNDQVPQSAATALTLPATGDAPERFDQLGLSDKTIRALKEDFKFETMTEIQRRTIPASLGNYSPPYDRRAMTADES